MFYLIIIKRGLFKGLNKNKNKNKKYLIRNKYFFSYCKNYNYNKKIEILFYCKHIFNYLCKQSSLNAIIVSKMSSEQQIIDILSSGMDKGIKMIKETIQDEVKKAVKKELKKAVKKEVRSTLRKKVSKKAQRRQHESVSAPEPHREPEPESVSAPEPPTPKVSKQVKKIQSKKVRLIINELVWYQTEERRSYTPEEIANMNDYQLIREFQRITGCATLFCNHCKKPTPLENWMHSIRKRCMKKNGLSETIQLPKTCDKQQAVNAICNPINNKVYPIFRSSEATSKQKLMCMETKKIRFEDINKVVAPYKY